MLDAASPPTTMARARWRIWLLAARPATLPAALAPVLVGGALAEQEADLRWGPFLATLLAALLLQVGVNFANDLADFQRGADTHDRLGPLRVTQGGLVTERQMVRATVLVFALAAGGGVYLIAVAGWPILAVGAASIVAALAYTGGPWPYGYRGLGDAFVFVFFGLVAVMGTDYVQRERLTWEAFAAALPVAMTVTAILVINNLRDRQTDARGGKRTLAVILGDRAVRGEYAALMLTPFLLLAVFAATAVLPAGALLGLLALPAAGWLVSIVWRGADGRALNPVLKRTGQAHLLLGVSLAAGLLL